MLTLANCVHLVIAWQLRTSINQPRLVVVVVVVLREYVVWVALEVESISATTTTTSSG